METAALTLLIIVSSILSVFLILLGITLIYFIRFLRRADKVADSVESAASAVKRGATAVPIIKLINNIIKKKKG